jgi:hypothetical protein
MQQAPVGVGAQVSVPHKVPGPWNTPFCAAQSACDNWWHEVVPPLVMQHAPGTLLVHPFAAHEVPTPLKMPCAATHCVNVRSWHVTPVGEMMQHAPVCVCACAATLVHSAASPTTSLESPLLMVCS